MTDKDIAELKAHCTMAGRGTLADWMSPYVLPLIEAIERLTGAMKADDERLRVHGERVGLFMDCDTAEHMADEILALRAELAALRPLAEAAKALRIAYYNKRAASGNSAMSADIGLEHSKAALHNVALAATDLDAAS